MIECDLNSLFVFRMHLIEAAGCIVSEIRYDRRCPLPQNILLVLAVGFSLFRLCPSSVPKFHSMLRVPSLAQSVSWRSL